MLHNLSLGVDAKDVNAGPVPVFVGGPLLVAVQDHEVALSDDTFEVHAFAGILAGHALEVINEGLFAILDMRVMLDVGASGIASNGFRRLALVKHQIIERLYVGLVALQSFAGGHSGRSCSSMLRVCAVISVPVCNVLLRSMSMTWHSCSALGQCRIPLGSTNA